MYKDDSPSLSSGHSYSFTQTDFTQCKGNQYGGAICLEGSSYQRTTSLYIIDATFTECYAEEGAGIYVDSIDSLKVSSSFFYNCGNADTVRGGGICMHTITTHEIKESMFLSQRTNEDGGALLFDSCTQNFHTITVKDIIFFH